MRVNALPAFFVTWEALTVMPSRHTHAVALFFLLLVLHSNLMDVLSSDVLPQLLTMLLLYQLPFCLQLRNLSFFFI